MPAFRCTVTMGDQLPRFTSEEEEREFWAEHDSTDYVDWARAERIRFPDLKPSSETAG